jgi:hypothetical protein
MKGRRCFLIKGRAWLLLGAILGIFLSPDVVREARGDDIASIHFEESYRGPHPNEFAELLSQVEAIVPAAVAYITGQWGLPNTLHHPFIVTITDVPSKDPARALAAYVRSTGYGDSLRQALVVDLEHHLLYTNDNLDSLIYHEMAHAILQDAVTNGAAAAIPRWFNEGLAQSVTPEGSTRTQEDFKRWGHSDARAVLCELNGPIDEMNHGEYNFGCYTQYYLAVQRLMQLGGKDTVPRIISGLHNGLPLPEVIRQLTLLDWAAFQNNVGQYTRDIFAGDQPIP